MKGKTDSAEEIIRILRQANTGGTAQSVCRKHHVSAQPFYRWKKENIELKKMLAESMLLHRVLKEANSKICRPIDEKRPCITLSRREGYTV